MKKLSLTCAFLLALVGLSAPDAEAQFCFKWVAFCDGIQVDDISNGRIDATWWNFDCAGSNAPFDDSVKKPDKQVQNACPGGAGTALINCRNCGGFGDWYFVVDSPLDGTLDVATGVYPNGTCWVDEVAYNIQIGPCTGQQQLGGGPGQMQGRSIVQ